MARPSSPERRPVALFGGSFDPPHHGHALIATWALCSGRFEEVRLIPVFAHAFGKPLSDFTLRVRMIEAAVAHLGPRIRVETVEGDLPAPSYTVDTVAALLAREPNLAPTFVVGADAWRSRRDWKDWERLATLVDFLVIGRANTPPPDDASVPFTLPDISSTTIRARIRAGEPTYSMLPPAVRAIVDAEGLYR